MIDAGCASGIWCRQQRDRHRHQRYQPVFHANKLVRDAGEVTNSYVYIQRLDRHLAVCIATSR